MDLLMCYAENTAGQKEINSTVKPAAGENGSVPSSFWVEYVQLNCNAVLQSSSGKPRRPLINGSEKVTTVRN